VRAVGACFHDAKARVRRNARGCAGRPATDRTPSKWSCRRTTWSAVTASASRSGTSSRWRSSFARRGGCGRSATPSSRCGWSTRSVGSSAWRATESRVRAVRWPAVRGVAQCPHGLAIAAVVLACLVGAAPVSARTTTALEVGAAGAPQAVFGSDRRERVEYDLVVTNVFSADATLQSLEVRGDGRRLLTLTGEALTEVTRKLLRRTRPRPSPPRPRPLSRSAWSCRGPTGARRPAA
jgi:hypothetical protein